MAQTTLTRSELAETLHLDVGRPRAEAGQLVEDVLTAVADALARGENVKLSSFGTFILRRKGSRIGRNPKTGIEVTIAPRTVLTFRPSHLLRGRINARP